MRVVRLILRCACFLLFPPVHSAKSQAKKQKKMRRTGEYPEVEKAAVTWFTRQRAAGIPVTQAMLLYAGNEFYRRLHPDKSKEPFTENWARKVMDRHHLRDVKTSGESRSADGPAAVAFREQFRKQYLEDEGYDERLIFNVDETGLFFRTLPDRTLASKIDERKAKG